MGPASEVVCAPLPSHLARALPDTSCARGTATAPTSLARAWTVRCLSGVAAFRGWAPRRPYTGAAPMGHRRHWYGRVGQMHLHACQLDVSSGLVLFAQGVRDHVGWCAWASSIGR